MPLIEELKRRNVVKVAVLYVVAAWLVLQIAELLFEILGLPDEWLKLVLALLILGALVVLVFSWVFEITPEGVKFERDVDRSQSITGQTGRRINTVIIVLLVVAVASIAVDRLIPEQAAEQVTNVAEFESEAAIAENSIAVLPFADLSESGDQEYFSDGIAEEILNVLVRTEGLEVASRTTSFGFKGQEALGLSVIADRMNVRHILEGSVRKAGQTVRITAQLIDAESDKHLWSETYDRELTAESIFAIQDEIAGAIVEQLGNLIAGGVSAPVVVADTENLEAYERYLEAHRLFTYRTELDRAMRLFEDAVESDPGFARAWAGLAAVYVVAPGWGYRDRGWREYTNLARNAADKAIELSPELSLPYAVLGFADLLNTPPDIESVMVNFDKALQRNPKDTTALLWRGSQLSDIGYFDRAERDLKRCLEIDPAYQHCRNYLAVTKLYAGDIDEAFRLYELHLLKGHDANSLPFDYVSIERGDNMTVLKGMYAWYSRDNTTAMMELDFSVLADRNFEFEEKRTAIEASYKAAYGEELVWEASSQAGFMYKNYESIKMYPDTAFWWYPYPEDFKQSPHRKRLIRDFGIFAYWKKHGFPPRCRPVGADDFECD